MRFAWLRESDRRALRLGGTIVAAALLFRFALLPYTRALGEAHRLLAAERALLARELGVATSGKMITREAERAKAALLVNATRVFGSESDNLVTADVARYLEEAAQAAQVNILELVPQKKPPNATGLRAVEMELRAQTDYEGLIEFIGSLERGTVITHVQALSVKAAPGQPVNAAQLLEVRATVHAFVLPSAVNTRTERVAARRPSTTADE